MNNYELNEMTCGKGHYWRAKKFDPKDCKACADIAAERELTGKLIEAINMVIAVREQEGTHLGDTQEIRACKEALSLVPADRRK